MLDWLTECVVYCCFFCFIAVLFSCFLMELCRIMVFWCFFYNSVVCMVLFCRSSLLNCLFVLIVIIDLIDYYVGACLTWLVWVLVVLAGMVRFFLVCLYDGERVAFVIVFGFDFVLWMIGFNCYVSWVCLWCCLGD